MLQIQGVIETIIYRNEGDGYTVAKVSTEDDMVTVVGNTTFVKVGDSVTLDGDFVYHPKYLEQFKFEKYEVQLPNSIEGIKKYLSGGFIPFIGKKTAEKIVETFGENALTIIQDNPNRLKEIEGIGNKKLEKIKEAFKEQRELRSLLLFTQNFGLGISTNIKIYKVYGDDAIDIIKDNPYRLAQDIRGIGFKKADEVAVNLGFDRDSEHRLLAGVKYIMYAATQEGHCYLPQEVLVKRAAELLNVDEKCISELFFKLALDADFYIQRKEEEINCYFSYLYRAENLVAGKLLDILNHEHKEYEFLDKEISEIENRQGIEFAQAQIQAIKEAVKNGLLVITGGPGTGKTTTLKAIIEVFESMDLKVSLAAPTGRAAKRMAQTTNRKAQTIHRLLDYSHGEEDAFFNKNENDPLETDVLIVDELSMVDLSLMSSLLKALEEGTRLILVGDASQLPSVGAGNVLSNIITSEKIKVVNLNKIFRQAEKSMIITNAHLINEGETPLLNKGEDFFMIAEESMAETSKIVSQLVSKRLPEFYGFNMLKDIQVLTPMRKGVVGVNNLNNILQNVINPSHPSKNEILFNNRYFREGDRVMQTKNNYQMQWTSEGDIFDLSGEGIFNGDMGFVESIDLEDNIVKVRIDDYKLVEYNYSNLEELQLSYATTIHKSQGSEFPVVIVPLHWAPEMLLTRNLLYTAITRATKLVVLVGQYKYLQRMVDNNKIQNRYSNLDEKIVNFTKFKGLK